MFQTEKLSPADAAILETFVVPRYLSLFGELAQEMLLWGEAGRLSEVPMQFPIVVKPAR